MSDQPHRTRCLGGWEVYWDKKEYVADYLTTHGVDREGFEFFKQIQYALELKISDRMTAAVIQHRRDGARQVAEQIALPLDHWEDRKVFLLVKDERGTHSIGGKPPEELVLPADSRLSSRFQYIGTLDGTDPMLQWMGVKRLHLVFPLFEANHGVYLDYRDPDRPKMIEPITVSDDWADPDLQDVQIEYAKVRYRSESRLDVQAFEKEHALLAGVPMWYQCPSVPRCPVTNERMRFVSSIRSDATIPVVGKDKGRDDILMFGDMGQLLIFFHPGSKVLYAIVEH